MTEQSHAVFLSYASQDAAAAERIAAALRAAGIEVFLDQSELRGGDLWDQKIRREIHECALFMPIVSQHTQERLEGYFRREWKLAIERMHDMAEQKAFLVPVVIDSTGDRDAVVPELFRASQWTRLPRGATPPAFVERVQRLLSPAAPIASATSAKSGSVPVNPHVPPSRWTRRALPIAVGVLLVAAAAYIAIDKLWISKRAAPTVAAPAAFAPPPHSIAVLPFVNMSGDKEQEYFSDGLTEEILNSLARINELQVSARTSSFSFKGKDADIGTIAHKLNVASVLEGSVRRAGNTIRVTAQLNNAVTGFHLWSETYDRDLKDVLKMQTDIANAIGSALKVTLLGDVAAKIQVGGTRNPAAFDAYLRASNAYWTGSDEEAYRAAIASYGEAIRLDPDFALAYADRSFVLTDFAQGSAKGPAMRDFLDRAQADALKAIALAPELAEGHFGLAVYYSFNLEFPRANREYQRALELAPGSAKLLNIYGLFAVSFGQRQAGLAAAQRSVTLDPLNPWYRVWLALVQTNVRRYAEAIATYKDAMSSAPNDEGLKSQANAWLAYAYYLSGDFENARAACENQGDTDEKPACLAMTYERLRRHADAKTMLDRLQTSSFGVDHPVWCAMVFAQWGDSGRGLDCLEKAMRLRDPHLTWLSFPLLDPLRKEPRFQAIERALRFPE